MSAEYQPAGVRARTPRLGLWLQLAWAAALLAPALTVYTGWHAWDFDNASMVLASGAIVLAFRMLPGRRSFFIVTAPLVVLGIAAIGAELVRDVDLIELAAQWRTFSAAEVASALRPYAGALVIATGMVAALCAACCRWAGAPRRRWVTPLLLLWIAVLAAIRPPTLWLRAWPGNALAIAAADLIDSRAATAYVLPYSEASNPRDRSSSWHGRSTAGAARQMTVVLVIGESVRADTLRECGGPDRLHALAPGALVACDVSAGSNATHTSVPLLVSRDPPGLPVRVSTDATFLDALHGAGFDSHWLAVQEPFIAWPDARHAQYRSPGIDRKVLLPMLDRALADAAPRKALVVHAYNAHVPYCARYDPARAPYPIDCPDQSRLPTRDDADAELLRAWRQTYANAVDESVRFVDAVIDRLRTLPGEVFLIYTPDHGENLLDDARALYGHALRTPSRWDISVPAVFWANDAWRSRHAQAWARLARNAAAPLMHADLVPTLLAAAEVTYDEPRASVVNLLGADVPPRRRIVQRAFGKVVDMQELMQQAAGAAGS